MKPLDKYIILILIIFCITSFASVKWFYFAMGMWIGAAIFAYLIDLDQKEKGIK
jgi:hypothetical protein